LLQRLKESGGLDAERERQKKLLQLKLDQRKLRQDDDILTAALLFNQAEQYA
jgi:hypothetical protein